MTEPDRTLTGRLDGGTVLVAEGYVSQLECKAPLTPEPCFFSSQKDTP